MEKTGGKTMRLRRIVVGIVAGAIAMAGAVFAGPDAMADTAVSSCQTLSAAGNYFLTTNLTATGDCIHITSDGVALDLKGHTITGDGSGAAINDDGFSLDSFAIGNGKIRHFDEGIDMGSSCCGAINNVDSSNNTSTGIFVGDCCGTLNSVKANNNGGAGILALDCCYEINKAQVTGNGAGGIVSSGCCTSVTGGTAANNTGVGIAGDECCNSVVTSKVQNNTGDGVIFTDCCNQVLNSTVSGNGGKGIDLEGDDNQVTNSKVSGNAGDGIHLRTHDNQITNSQSNSNGGFGASIGCRGTITGLQTKGNTGGALETIAIPADCTMLNNKLL
jgi:hypothetical protein